MCRTGRGLPRVLLIDGLEFILGTVEKDAEIVAIDAKFAANLVFVLIFQEHSAEKGLITLGQGGEDQTNLLG